MGIERTSSPYPDPRELGPKSKILATRTGNYHSTSLRNMVTINTVNKTALHPGGVQPVKEHTELEEELHEKAHIDYDRVAIVPNPSVAALYEDALVYETGSAITSTGALTAYSGAKTGRSPLHPEPYLRRRRICRMGQEVPDQSPSRLRPCLPCSVHEEYAHPTRSQRSRAFPPRLYYLQCRILPSKQIY